MSEPARTETARRLDVRVGSSTNALHPISGAQRHLGAGLAQWTALAVIAGTAVAADQLTKAIVSSRLAVGAAVAPLGPFSIHHVENSGIAFGLFSDSTTAVILLTSLAVAAMLLFFSRAAQRHPLLPVSLGLVIGGSIANLFDRIRLGHVTDFLDFDYWPAFNLADTFIVVGVGLLFASFIAADRTSPRVGARLRFHVPEREAGSRLDRVLAARPELGSRGLAERLIAAGAVLVDGEPRAKSFRLEGGEEIAAELPALLPLQSESLDIPIVWEDEHLLIVDKPSGLVVHPAGSTRTGTLVQGLLDHGAEGGEDDDRPGIVHRLDRDTSGLLVVARSENAYLLLQEMIRTRAVERTYAALVRGTPQSASGRIEAPIGRDRRDRTRHSLDTPTPRDAVTSFEVRETLPHHALLDVRLETGRTHQIRVHLEAIGLPVSGDPVYGVAGDLGLARQFLHARRLAFAHPLTGAELDVSSELPGDLAAALVLARG